MSSLRDWTPPFDWANKIDQIWKTTISRAGFTNNYDEYIKTGLINNFILLILYQFNSLDLFYTSRCKTQ